jgi:hypothetical protein
MEYFRLLKTLVVFKFRMHMNRNCDYFSFGGEEIVLQPISRLFGVMYFIGITSFC